jgi:hypothetical protein
MNLAIVLVVLAVASLVVIVRLSVFRRLPVLASSPERQLQPIDIEAFCNLADPAQTDYLRQRLPAVEFRRVQRQRLRAMAAYLKTASLNAAVLAQVAQSALTSNDAATAEAARQLVENALLLRRNAVFARVKINAALVWPNTGSVPARFLQGYQQLSVSAMLLGRLQQPAVPVRISAS